MGEFGAPDATDADGRRVDDPLVVDHREGVAFLDAEEVDAPLVDLFQFGGQRIGHLLAHDGAPQRTVDRGLFLLTADADGFFAERDADRIGAVETENDVLGCVAFVDQIVQMRGVERVFVDEDRVGIAGTDAVEREVGFGRAVEPVDGRCAYSVAVQDTSHRFARGDFAVFDAVVVGRDAVEQILLDDLFFGLCVVRSGGAARTAAPGDPCDAQRREFHQSFHHVTKL